MGQGLHLRGGGAGHCTSVGQALHFSGVGHYILVGRGFTFQWGKALHFNGAGLTLEGGWGIALELGGALHLSGAGHYTLSSSCTSNGLCVPC